MSDSSTHINVEEEEDEEFWNRWRSNTYECKLVKPMKKRLTALWDLPISDFDVEKLKAGFRPRNLDDKYAWLIGDEDESGDITIHVIRYFVQEEIYILHIDRKSNNNNGAIAKIHSITWEGNVNGIQKDVEQAKQNVVLLARVILKCDFEAHP